MAITLRKTSLWIVGAAAIGTSALNSAGVAGLDTEDFEDEIGLYARTYGRRF